MGTSLDGPEYINDSQRGKGSYRQTMDGILMLQKYGFDVGCIATFTPSSLNLWREVMDFFISERLDFSVHWAMSKPDQMDGAMIFSESEITHIVDLFDYYVANRKKIAISTFDSISRGVLTCENSICTFRDCSRMFLAIDSEGWIYPCQRFCGKTPYRMGHVGETLSLENLYSSPIATDMKKRAAQVKEKCRSCSSFSYCHGGCYYTARITGKDIDPLCPIHKRLFVHITDRTKQEVSLQDNVEAVAANPFDKNKIFLFYKGPVIELANGDLHPSKIAMYARRVVASVELARGPDDEAVVMRLIAKGICRSRKTAINSLMHLRKVIENDTHSLNNIYVHVTYACQLSCNHCYAHGEDGNSEEMPLEGLLNVVHQAKDVNFRQLVVTGGEPLLHSLRREILYSLADMRKILKPLCLTLRTNFALHLSEEEIKNLATSFDKIIVSIDGDEKTHDARRGTGAYAASVRNMELYQSTTQQCNNPATLSIAATLSMDETRGRPGQDVRTLGQYLGVNRILFRPLLPLGRAGFWKEPPRIEPIGDFSDSLSVIEKGFQPKRSCGIGYNLSIVPLGDSFPCYVYHNNMESLGNVFEHGLDFVINSDRFRDLSHHHVDTNRKCRLCEFRYICGGACRAWYDKLGKNEFDAPPIDCEALREKALNLYLTAIKYIEQD